MESIVNRIREEISSRESRIADLEDSDRYYDRVVSDVEAFINETEVQIEKDCLDKFKNQLESKKNQSNEDSFLIFESEIDGLKKALDIIGVDVSEDGDDGFDSGDDTEDDSEEQESE